jgi:hypothetical protein
MKSKKLKYYRSRLVAIPKMGGGSNELVFNYTIVCLNNLF